MTELDHPVWAALTTRQQRFALGGERALRYQRDVEPFADTADDNPASLAELTKLMSPGELVVLIRPTDTSIPPSVTLVHDRVGVQMVATSPVTGSRPEGAEPLGAADAPEMISLAELTEPGPFRARTHELGQFWGIRCDGQLVAMAGERMKLPGLTELSGVCVHPDWRGHGFARALSAFVAAEIVGRGETPFLHAYADNRAAIRLYEQLGFSIRREMAVHVIVRA